MSKLFVVIASTGQYEDSWMSPVLSSADRAKLEEFIAVSTANYERYRTGSQLLSKFLNEFGCGPDYNWTPETTYEEEEVYNKIYQEWEDTVRTPAKIAFLLTQGFTEEEAKFVPEYPEEVPYYSIEEVYFI